MSSLLVWWTFSRPKPTFIIDFSTTKLDSLAVSLSICSTSHQTCTQRNLSSNSNFPTSSFSQSTARFSFIQNECFFDILEKFLISFCFLFWHLLCIPTGYWLLSDIHVQSFSVRNHYPIISVLWIHSFYPAEATVGFVWMWKVSIHNASTFPILITTALALSHRLVWCAPPLVDIFTSDSFLSVADPSAIRSSILLDYLMWTLGEIDNTQ